VLRLLLQSVSFLEFVMPSRPIKPQLLELPQPGRVLARRVDQLAEELGFDRARLRGWGVAQAVLSAWWSVEDFGKISDSTIACAELLAEIKV